MILPEGYDPEEAIQKHERWIKDKLNIIEQAVKEAEEKTLVNKSRNELREIIEKLTRGYEKELGIRVNNIFIRRMKTKWASCSPKQNLTVNELARYLPEQLLGYIVYHEMVHLLEKRHTEKFWKLVSKRYANHQKLERKLLSYWFLIMKKIISNQV